MADLGRDRSDESRRRRLFERQAHSCAVAGKPLDDHVLLLEVPGEAATAARLYQAPSGAGARCA